MSALSASTRSAAKSRLVRLSLGVAVTVGFAAGASPASAEAKSSDARAHGKRAVSTHGATTSAAHRKNVAKVRVKARAAGRKIG